MTALAFIYRRCQDMPKGEGDYLQLLLPRADVQSTLNQCHGGAVGGHFGEKKTMDQVRRCFYWHQWKEDVRRFCRQCLQCNRYHWENFASRAHFNQLFPVLPLSVGTSILPDCTQSLNVDTCGY